MQLWILFESFLVSYGLFGLAAFWGAKLGLTWVGLRWWKNRRAGGLAPRTETTTVRRL